MNVVPQSQDYLIFITLLPLGQASVGHVSRDLDTRYLAVSERITTYNARGI